MENTTYLEPINKRIKRFKNNGPVEIIANLLLSINSNFNNEIRLTVEGNNYQTSLLFLGTHAIALTISEAFFNKRSLGGYELFLKKFIDGQTLDTQFSKIAKIIHDWRNVLAHQWLSHLGYKVGYDYEMLKGWEDRKGVIFINPKIFCDYFLKTFGRNGRIYTYKSMFTDIELQEIKRRLLKKFLPKTRYIF